MSHTLLWKVYEKTYCTNTHHAQVCILYIQYISMSIKSAIHVHKHVFIFYCKILVCMSVPCMLQGSVFHTRIKFTHFILWNITRVFACVTEYERMYYKQTLPHYRMPRIDSPVVGLHARSLMRTTGTLTRLMDPLSQATHSYHG